MNKHIVKKSIASMLTVIVLLMPLAVLTGCQNNETEEEDTSGRLRGSYNPPGNAFGIEIGALPESYVPGFLPIVSLDESKYVLSSDEAKYSYWTVLRNPTLYFNSKPAVNDQIELYVATDFIAHNPETFGLSDDDYAGFDVDWFSRDNEIFENVETQMVLQYGAYYYESDSRDTWYFWWKNLPEEEIFPNECAITVNDITVHFMIGDHRGWYSSIEVNYLDLSDMQLHTMERLSSSENRMTFASIYAVWNYNNIGYMLSTPLLLYAGGYASDDPMIYPFTENEWVYKYAKEYYDGSYNIFAYSEEHFEELSHLNNDYIKIRVLAKKVLENLITNYFCAQLRSEN